MLGIRDAIESRITPRLSPDANVPVWSDAHDPRKAWLGEQSYVDEEAEHTEGDYQGDPDPQEPLGPRTPRYGYGSPVCAVPPAYGCLAPGVCVPPRSSV